MPVAKALSVVHKDEITWEIMVDEKGVPFIIVRRVYKERT
jgi:hypothetical protein